MLEASEKDLPEDYNPPARLANAYKAMKKWDEALAASDRAMAKVYGPRKLGVYSTRVDILSGKGDAAGGAPHAGGGHRLRGLAAGRAALGGHARRPPQEARSAEVAGAGATGAAGGDARGPSRAQPSAAAAGDDHATTAMPARTSTAPPSVTGPGTSCSSPQASALEPTGSPIS